MKRLWWLLGALILCAGCASDGKKSDWDDFWKDLRGDNMEMKGFSSRDEQRGSNQEKN